MYKNIYPLFVRKRMLTKEMLENLRDYPRIMPQILYQDYSDGIVAGSRLKVKPDGLAIEPGILWYKKVLYVLEEEITVPCEASGRQVYLKVKFEDKAAGISQDEYLSQICLDETEPDPDCELELCRFKLQEGARLRDTHTDFFDYHTEFDTLCLIHAPYASPVRSSICPQILHSFAAALLKRPIESPWDYPFILRCMKTQDTVSYGEVQTYLNMRLNLDRDGYTNAELYELLKRILLEAGNKGSGDGQMGRNQGKMLLL